MTRQDRPGRMLGTLLSIAGGGALGALARHLAGLGFLRLLGPTTFPLAIITVNVLGSFLIGFFVVLAAQRGLAHLSPFFVVGFLGAFTTFSAFSLEAVQLYQRGDIVASMIYVVASVVLSILGLLAGLALARMLLS